MNYPSPDPILRNRRERRLAWFLFAVLAAFAFAASQFAPHDRPASGVADVPEISAK